MPDTLLLNDLRLTGEMTCVCCNCLREKVGTDEWQEHTPRDGERLSHGICPACLYELYPDIAPLIRNR